MNGVDAMGSVCERLSRRHRFVQAGAAIGAIDVARGRVSIALGAMNGGWVGAKGVIHGYWVDARRLPASMAVRIGMLGRRLGLRDWLPPHRPGEISSRSYRRGTRR